LRVVPATTLSSSPQGDVERVGPERYYAPLDMD
jgi:hypothetical protein